MQSLKAFQTYLVGDQNIVSLCNSLGQVSNKRVLEVAQATGFPVGLNPCKVGELH